MTNFKTYETAREIFDCLVDFHHRVVNLAEAGMDMEQEERVALVFNYLYDHHLRMGDALANYDDDGDHAVLNTPAFFELDADDAPEAYIDELQVDENMSFEDAAKIGRDLAEYAVDLLNNICGEIDTPDVQRVFEEVLEMEQDELKLLLRGINALRDF